VLNLQDVHARIRQKRKESSEIKRSIADELANNPRYQQLVEEIKKLKEEKKSFENQAWAAASHDAEKLDLLKLDIASDKQVLSDVALNMYVAGEKVEVIDENNTRWVPNFSVTFTKDKDSVPDDVPAKTAASTEPF
jgi:ethanolamine utilization protein EutQ (cupin superfamily)